MDPSHRYQDLLQLLGLSPQRHNTCLGTAKSTNQQCRCAVALKYRKQATHILSTVAIANLTVEGAKEEMGFMAKLLLCRRYHQDQSAGLSSVWTDKLRSSHFTTHTATAHTGLDGNSGSRGTGQNSQHLQQVHTIYEPREVPGPANASTEDPDLTVETNNPSARRGRASDRPLSMTLRSAMRATRGSHQECPICKDKYGPRDSTVVSCVECQNIYHRGCAEEWKREHDTCPFW